MSRFETIVPGIPVVDLVETPDMNGGTSVMGVTGVQSLPWIPNAPTSFYSGVVAGGATLRSLTDGIWAYAITNAAGSVGRQSTILSIPLNRNLRSGSFPASGMSRRYTWEAVIWRDVLTVGSDYSVQLATTNSVRPLSVGSNSFNQGYELASLDSRNAGNWTVRRRLVDGVASADVVDTGVSPLAPVRMQYILSLTTQQRQLDITLDGAVVFSTDLDADFPNPAPGTLSNGVNFYGLSFVSSGAIGGFCYLTSSRYRIDAL